ncbi:MarR family winged helix-turn-helix transcriptional regulator [Latilactobacillus sakei]|uniref:MarR family winged helix-turn-helix transcriptional regulator n=1 Tax=Latilactobacillus sakei TaxID=1599 RepID=UPI003886011E
MSKLAKLQEMIAKLHAENNQDPERDWLLQHLQTNKTPEMMAQAKKLTHSELAILTQLAQAGEAIPFKQLQAQSELSQGMLSRYIQRLAKNRLVEKFHTPENQKAVVLRITARGQEIGELHHQLHQRQRQNYEAVLANYSEAEVETIAQFIEQMIAARENL